MEHSGTYLNMSEGDYREIVTPINIASEYFTKLESELDYVQRALYDIFNEVRILADSQMKTLAWIPTRLGIFDNCLHIGSDFRIMQGNETEVMVSRGDRMQIKPCTNIDDINEIKKIVVDYLYEVSFTLFTIK